MSERGNERALRVNKQTEERMAQYSTRQFHSHSTQCYPLLPRSTLQSITQLIPGFRSVFPSFVMPSLAVSLRMTAERMLS